MREASVQALIYLKSHGKYDPRRLILGTLKFSSEWRYPARILFLFFCLNTVHLLIMHMIGATKT